MLYESDSVRVETDDGIATLWLDLPGPAINALGPTHLEDLGKALRATKKRRGILGLIIRSAKAQGFCAGADVDSLTRCQNEYDRAEYAARGQKVLSEITSAPWPTVAFIHGPCLGPGFELALACTFRVAVTGLDSQFGFPFSTHGLPPCWGSTTRLSKAQLRTFAIDGQLLTAREAQQLGVVDLAICSRNANIELQQFVNQHVREPKRGRLTTRSPIAYFHAQERKSFVEALRSTTIHETFHWHSVKRQAPSLTPVAYVGKINLPMANLLAGAAVRGSSVAVVEEANEPAVTRAFDHWLSRGLITPLERNQALARFSFGGTLGKADIVFLATSDPAAGDGLETSIKPRTIVAVLTGRIEPLQGQFYRPERVVALGLPLPQLGSNVNDIGVSTETELWAAEKLSTWLHEQNHEGMTLVERPGLASRRLASAWFDEAIQLVSEGCPIDEIDRLAQTAGFQFGPLALLDELGFEGWALRRLLPLRAVGWVGKTGGQGFYEYPRRRKCVPNLAAASLLWDSRIQMNIGEGMRPNPVKTIEQRDIVDRLLYRVLNEAMDIPLLSTELLDRAVVKGTGFFANWGGPSLFLKARGLGPVMTRLTELSAKFGPRFHPCAGFAKRAPLAEPSAPGLAAAG